MGMRIAPSSVREQAGPNHRSAKLHTREINLKRGRGFWVRLFPKILGNFEWVNLAIGPPGFFMRGLVPVAQIADDAGRKVVVRR